MNNQERLLRKLLTLGACLDALVWITDDNIANFRQAWEECDRDDWMWWLVSTLGQNLFAPEEVYAEARAVYLYGPDWVHQMEIEERYINIQEEMAKPCIQGNTCTALRIRYPYALVSKWLRLVPNYRGAITNTTANTTEWRD